MLKREIIYIKKYARSASGCYIRMGTTTRSMTEEQIEKRYIESINIKERSIIDIYSPKQNLTFNILKNLLISKNYHINDETFYQNYSFLTKDGKFNRYSNLLSDEADVSIKVAVFKGKDKTEFLKRNEYGFQSIIIAMQKVIDYCDAINETYIDLSVRQDVKKECLVRMHLLKHGQTL